MTNTQVDGATLVVVDGSNIATEGRSVPSLTQLNDAVLALTSEFPEITVTVVVDATFGHRIDKSEVAEFDEAVAHNELVTPPAGAIGRGDAFVLSIANKVGARIFSNDSFQEFHGVYSWLFDEGRLIGGKPVPHVGWVFVNRVPVKGPVSRKARSTSNDAAGSRRTSSKLASLPMPIPTSPPPGRVAAKAAAVDNAPASSGRGRRRKGADAPSDVPPTGRDVVQPATTPAASAPPSGGPVNDLLPFLDFVEHHPVGSAVTGVVETYSSHGAYVKIGDVRGYVPLRLMASPPPRSAREVMRLAETVALVVASFAPTRRSIDLAVPGVADVAPAPAEEPAPKRRGRKAAAAPTPEAAPAPEEQAPAEQAPAEPARDPRRRRRAKPAEPSVADVPTESVAPATEPPASSRRRSKAGGGDAAAIAESNASKAPKPATKTAAKKAEASEPAARKPAATKAAAKKSAAKKAADRAPAPADDTKAPTKRTRAAKAAAAASAVAAADGANSAPGTPKGRGANKAASPKAEAATVDAAGAKADPASRRRRSKPSAGD